MAVSLETLSELQRKLTISIADNEIQDEVNVRLKNLAPKVQIPGFRQGKVPLKVVRERFIDKVRLEVINEMMSSALENAIESHALKLTAYPSINVVSNPQDGDFSFEAVVEVFPEVAVKELDNCEIEIIDAAIDATDVEDMMKKLREHHKEWKDVTRASVNGDQLFIDFKGFIDDVAFAGGEANNFKMILGEKQMLPDFENGLLNRKAGDEFDIEVKFPEDYGQEELNGKTVRFTIKVNQVQEGDLPELNEDFLKKFSFDGDMAAFSKDIESNMQRELKKTVSSVNRKNVFDKLMSENIVDLPQGLIEREIGELKHQMFHRIFGAEHHDNEKIPDFPNELFMDEAKRRVHLSLLYLEYVKKHNLTVEPARLDAMLEDMTSMYDDPEQAREMYKKDQNRLEDLKSLLMEEIVMEKILEFAKPILKKMNYRETMEFANRKNDGESE